MFLNDTNVVSRLVRPRPHASVRAWLASQRGPEVFLPVIVEAERRYGAALLPPGGRRERPAEQVEQMLQDDFYGRILPFDGGAALATRNARDFRNCGIHIINPWRERDP